MGKVFLSHSSNDKDFVEPIANLLGKQKCVYDKYTFEMGTETIEQIISGLKSTDIFVYFISNDSLNSEWVKDELNRAEEAIPSSTEKLKQIFPIIIDPDINHSDNRIAPFLRKNYNLQRVLNYKIAYRKIRQQISKLNFNNNMLLGESTNNYYGRDKEIEQFRNRVDNIDLPPLKSIVVSGIPGIGKKAFIKEALSNTDIIKRYYEPILLSMSKNNNIEDLILSISDAGFGDYSFDEIVSITDMKTKINILVNLFNTIQKYNEIIIIEDDECLITLNGTMCYWLEDAIEQSDNGLSVIITSNINANKFKSQKYKCIEYISLSELSDTDKMGLLRVLANKNNINIKREDYSVLKDCLTGYPPQINETIELIKEYGIDHIIEHTYLVSEIPEQVSSNIVNLCQEKCSKEHFQSLLAIIAELEFISANMLNKICKLDGRYKEAFLIIRRYSVCYYIGANKEYVKLNSFISNFVTRNNMQVLDDINQLIRNELEKFNAQLNETTDLFLWDTSELKYYLKANLKENICDVSGFIYSTITLKSITELYHEQLYSKVINLFNEIKQNNRYQYFDQSVKNTLHRYYCQALIKNKNADFDAEVQFFADEKLWIDYYFLQGFNYRYSGEYKKAEEMLDKVLQMNQSHLAAKRELVMIYIALQDYDSAISLAKNNYYKNRENTFVIQAYFECLIEKNVLDKQEKEDLDNMLSSIKRIHRIKSTPIYYQLIAKNEAYKNKNIDKAIDIINQGITNFPGSMYLIRDKFDIYKRSKDIVGMEKTINELKKVVVTLEYKGVLYTRQAILKLFKGESTESVQRFLRNNVNMSEEAIDKIVLKYKS